MKNSILIFIIVIVFSGCQSLKFDRFPGESIATFPENLQGKYLYIHHSSNKSDSDTIIVSSNTYTTIESGVSTVKLLDAENIFSTYKEQQFLFMKNESYWIGFKLQKNRKGIILLPIVSPAKDDTKRNLKILNKYFTDIKVLPGTNSLEGSSFSVKMNEDNLLKYIKKSKRISVKLIQVKE